MEHYISEHQRLNQKLDKAKRPLTDEQKTTFFLSGIKDRAYQACKSLCNAQQYNFEKCVHEIRRESMDVT